MNTLIANRAMYKSGDASTLRPKRYGLNHRVGGRKRSIGRAVTSAGKAYEGGVPMARSDLKTMQVTGIVISDGSISRAYLRQCAAPQRPRTERPSVHSGKAAERRSGGSVVVSSTHATLPARTERCPADKPSAQIAGGPVVA